MKKKILIWVLAAVLVLSMAGCAAGAAVQITACVPHPAGKQRFVGFFHPYVHGVGVPVRQTVQQRTVGYLGSYALYCHKAFS